MASAVKALLDQWSDAFGNQLVRTTRNNADLAAHYAFTPERLRFYRDGAREVIHYDLAQDINVAGFEDKRPGAEDVYHLTPAAAETTDLETVAEFPDATGTVGATAGDPGGWQGAFDVTRANYRTGGSSAGTDLDEKHGVYDGDIAVLITDAESNTPMNFAYVVEMDE